MNTVIKALPWLLLALCADPLAAQTVTRGPYLQQTNESGVVIRWRTSSSVVGRVRYGTTQGSLTSVKDETSATTEHIVTLRDLTPNTRYFYSVGTPSATIAGGDANHFFVTAPTPGTAKRSRIWVIGDAGTADSRQRSVYNAYTNFTGSTQTDLWLMLGDNAYSNGTDAEHQAAVFDMYKPLLAKSPVWSCYGNHDGQSADAATQSGVYFDVFSFPTRGECGGLASGTEAYYSFDYGNIHFISLDSYETSRSVGGTMHTWTKNDANSTKADWLIAFWHHPPYTRGSYDSDTGSPLIAMRKNFLPMLEDAGVDLVLCGHSHVYERSFLIDGHYETANTFTSAMKKDGGSGRDPNPYRKSAGLQPHEGAVYVVAGSSGHISGTYALDHPVMFVSLRELGSLVLDIDGNRLDAKFIRENGQIDDSFSIVKGGSTAPSTDTDRPTITVESPTTSASFTTNSPAVHLAGTAADNVGVTRVDWTNSAGGTGVSAGTTAWRSYIGLAPGPNTITFTARDASGNTASDAITIEYAPDSTPGPDPTPAPGSDPTPTPDPADGLDDDQGGESSSGGSCSGTVGAVGPWMLIPGLLALAVLLRRR